LRFVHIQPVCRFDEFLYEVAQNFELHRKLKIKIKTSKTYSGCFPWPMACPMHSHADLIWPVVTGQLFSVWDVFSNESMDV
jgi:hypothetical protein